MKNKVIRIIALIFIILMASFIISAITNKCEAVIDVMEDPDYWKPDEDADVSDELEEKIGVILGVVSIVGVLLSVATLSVIGIKFMVASVEEKGQYKQTLIPWLIGAILVFTSTTLPTAIYNMMSGVNEIEEVSLRIDKSNVLLKIGEYEEVTLKVTEISDANRKVNWLTSNSKVATVDSNGKVTAKSAGTATITAVSGKGEASCMVVVEAPLTTAVTISKSSIDINQMTPKTYRLTATITPANSIQPISWSSSNSRVATVENGVVKAVGSGEAVITATSGTKSASCTVKVEGERVYEGRYYNPSTGEVSSTWTSSEDLQFLLYIPDISQVSSIDELPLIIFLHGYGEVGYTPNDLKGKNFFGLNQNADYPAIIIQPICPSGMAWSWEDNERSMPEKIKGLIEYSIENYNVDADKVGLTGFSYGGDGAWLIGRKYYNLFSCVVPVCPAGPETPSARPLATTYPDCPVWLIASTGDGTNSYRTNVEPARKVKVDIRQGVSHSQMQQKIFVDSTDVINWMIERSRATNSSFQF